MPTLSQVAERFKLDLEELRDFNQQVSAALRFAAGTAASRAWRREPV